MALDFGQIRFSAVSAHFSALQHMLITAQPLNHLQRCGSRSSGYKQAPSLAITLLPSLWTQQWQAIGGLPSLHIHPHSALTARLANLQTRKVPPRPLSFGSTTPLPPSQQRKPSPNQGTFPRLPSHFHLSSTNQKAPKIIENPTPLHRGLRKLLCCFSARMEQSQVVS